MIPQQLGVVESPGRWWAEPETRPRPAWQSGTARASEAAVAVKVGRQGKVEGCRGQP